MWYKGAHIGMFLGFPYPQVMDVMKRQSNEVWELIFYGYVGMCIAVCQGGMSNPLSV